MKKYNWLVIQYKGGDRIWIGGIYTTKKREIQNCLTEDFLVMRIEVNKEAKLEPYVSDYSWYPHLQEEPKK